MIDLQLLKEFRTKEELINYFEKKGIKISEIEICALKEIYRQTKVNNSNLTLKQLDDVVGGVLFLVKNCNGEIGCYSTHARYKINGDNILGIGYALSLINTKHTLLRYEDFSKMVESDFFGLYSTDSRNSDDHKKIILIDSMIPLVMDISELRPKQIEAISNHHPIGKNEFIRIDEKTFEQVSDFERQQIAYAKTLVERYNPKPESLDEKSPSAINPGVKEQKIESTKGKFYKVIEKIPMGLAILICAGINAAAVTFAIDDPDAVNN